MSSDHKTPYIEMIFLNCIVSLICILFDRIIQRESYLLLHFIITYIPAGLTGTNKLYALKEQYQIYARLFHAYFTIKCRIWFSEL